jgi:DNA-binding XRE family transcriptional regulator
MSTGLAEERSAKKNRELRKLEQEKEHLLERLQIVTQAIREAARSEKRTMEVVLAKLRAELGWTRAQMSNLLNASERAIVNWEKGEPMSAIYASKLRELQDIYNELSQLMDRKAVGKWLLGDLEEFGGRAPADLIRRGETGQVWASLFYLKSGMPE